MCGNFGLLALAGVDEETIQAILREMAALTELRGALGAEPSYHRSRAACRRVV